MLLTGRVASMIYTVCSREDVWVSIDERWSINEAFLLIKGVAFLY
jgi:hypothetical protein